MHTFSNSTLIFLHNFYIRLAGRDLVATSYTGSGKTMVFMLPMICMAYLQESVLPLKEYEGPLFVVICPSRELAQQTTNSFNEMIALMNANAKQSANIKVCLAMGGIPIIEQISRIRE